MWITIKNKIGLGILFLILFASCEKKSEKMVRWNVLFIAVDDLRPELGCYGKSYMHTPNIDKLAESGAVFTNHFVQIPTCGASRCSMLTGMLPKSTKYLSNEACRTFISGKPEMKIFVPSIEAISPLNIKIKAQN